MAARPADVVADAVGTFWFIPATTAALAQPNDCPWATAAASPCSKALYCPFSQAQVGERPWLGTTGTSPSNVGLLAEGVQTDLPESVAVTAPGIPEEVHATDLQDGEKAPFRLGLLGKVGEEGETFSHCVLTCRWRITDPSSLRKFTVNCRLCWSIPRYNILGSPGKGA